MIRSAQFLVLSGLLALGSGVFAQDTNFWIFLCFGQSNMEGFPGIEEQDKSGVDDRRKTGLWKFNRGKRSRWLNRN
jgi:hypothetical protein